MSVKHRTIDHPQTFFKTVSSMATVLISVLLHCHRYRLAYIVYTFKTPLKFNAPLSQIQCFTLIHRLYIRLAILQTTRSVKSCVRRFCRLFLQIQTPTTAENVECSSHYSRPVYSYINNGSLIILFKFTSIRIVHVIQLYRIV